VRFACHALPVLPLGLPRAFSEAHRATPFTNAVLPWKPEDQRIPKLNQHHTNTVRPTRARQENLCLLRNYNHQTAMR
jgi:hypothetical protein